MQFRTGMACCNPFREKAGMCCDLDAQLHCAFVELTRLAEHAPGQLPSFLSALLPIFPVDMLFVGARQAGYVDVFIICAAKYCATFSTRERRRIFYEFLATSLSAEQCDRFEAAHAAEWKRLRGK